MGPRERESLYGKLKKVSARNPGGFLSSWGPLSSGRPEICRAAAGGELFPADHPRAEVSKWSCGLGDTCTADKPSRRMQTPQALWCARTATPQLRYWHPVANRHVTFKTFFFFNVTESVWRNPTNSPPLPPKKDVFATTCSWRGEREGWGCLVWIQ